MRSIFRETSKDVCFSSDKDEIRLARLIKPGCKEIRCEDFQTIQNKQVVEKNHTPRGRPL